MIDVDNYYVTDNTRRLWNVELDMADVLLKVCQRFNLRIWAYFGTLLGAARHKGFIPWDDDLDFVMMREDYDYLIELVKKRIVEPFLPSNYTFDIDDISVLKLRRCDTTAIHPQKRWGSNMNQGVWIDVFCLDVAPDDTMSESDWFKELNSDERLYRNRVFLVHPRIALASLYSSIEKAANSLSLWFPNHIRYERQLIISGIRCSGLLLCQYRVQR